MYIKQVLNNNVVIALDDSKQEIIVMAKGIGFKNKNNSVVDENDYPDLQKYVLDNARYDEIRQAYQRIPQDLLDLSSLLLEKEKVQKEIKNFISIHAVMLLADHIYETIQRLQKGMYLRNALTNEIKTFYHDEFVIGVEAKETLMEKYNIVLDDDEISFIAIHLINLSAQNMNETITSIQIVDDLVNIVRRMMNIELKIKSYTYTRFITHLKYFSLRILNNQKVNTTYDKKLEKFLKDNYKLAYSCATAMKRYIYHHYHYEISNDEVMFLALHLECLEREEDKDGITK